MIIGRADYSPDYRSKDAALTGTVHVDRSKELANAVLKFSNHTNHCRYHGGHDCDCGLDEARALARSAL